MALHGHVKGQVRSPCFLPKGLKPSKSNGSYICEISQFFHLELPSHMLHTGKPIANSSTCSIKF